MAEDDDLAACALLAQEVADDPGRSADRTCDPETVADLDAYLAETF